jgi:hypothetical protein
MSPSSRTASASLPRVLLVSSTLDDDGGVPVCVGQLAEGLAGIGVPVGITGQHAGPLGAVIAAAGRRSGVTLDPVSAPWNPRGQWQAAQRVRRVVEVTASAARAEGRSLVVHLHGVWVAPVLAAAAAAVDAGATLVVSPHGMLRREALRKSPWRKRAVWEGWLRRALVAADTLHVTSTRRADGRRVPHGEPDTSGGSSPSRISTSSFKPGTLPVPRGGGWRSTGLGRPR